MLNATDMQQFYSISLVSNVVTVFSTVWILGLIYRLTKKRPDLFPNAWAAWPAIACLASSASVHACHLAILYAKVRVLFLVTDAIHAALTLFAVACARVVFYDLIKAPGVKALQATNDALARKLADSLPMPQ